MKRPIPCDSQRLIESCDIITAFAIRHQLELDKRRRRRRKKMRRKKVMLARKFDANAFAKWPRPCFAQPKINGRRCLAYCGFQDVSLRSSEDHEIISLPTLVEQLKAAQLPPGTILDGELHVPEWSFQQLCRVVGRSQSVHADEAEVNFYVFDTVEQLGQKDRLWNLTSLMSHVKGNIRMVETWSLETDEELWKRYDYFIADGWEGIILRHPEALYEPLRSANMMKLKPRKKGIAVVTGVLVEMSISGRPKNSLGALEVTTGDASFKIGSGFTRAKRQELWDEPPIGRTVEFLYQELSDYGVPIFPVYSKLV